MEKSIHPNTRHGHKAGGKSSPTYQTWCEMKRRCQDVNRHDYERYGGRGIKICERWQDFANFLKDMGVRPPGKTLDRVDNSKGYEPSNCRWATRKEQIQNRRVPKNQRLFFAINRQDLMILSNNQHEFARRYNLNQCNITNCLSGRNRTHKGWRFLRIPTSLN